MKDNEGLNWGRSGGNRGEAIDTRDFTMLGLRGLGCGSEEFNSSLRFLVLGVGRCLIF